MTFNSPIMIKHILTHFFLHTVVKGNSHNLLKAGAKRRRTQAEIQRAKLAEAERLRDLASKMEKVAQMEEELAQLRESNAQINNV